jgi:hypothetical protein
VREPHTERLDEAVADGEGRPQRDLLGRDGGDQRLEGIGGERGPEPAQPLDEAPEDRISGGEGDEGVEVERAAEVPPHRCDESLVGGLDTDPSRRRFDSDLDAVPDAMEALLVPEVGEVRSERAEALGRELPGERLGQLDDYARATRRIVRTR